MSEAKPVRGMLLKGALVAVVCLCSAASNAQLRRTPFLYDNCPQPVRLSPDQREEAVRALAAAIRAELSQLSSTASAQDIEAAIAFAFSQANAPAEIAQLAVTYLEGDPNLNANVRRALANARLALDTCRGAVGTAAIGQGAGTGSFFSSTPILGVGGGGSSNYTSD